MPVCKEIRADLLTPLSAFLKVAEHADYAFLFESVEGGEQVARYSFLGKDPFLVLRARDGATQVEQGGVATTEEVPFLDRLRSVMSDYRAPVVPGLPRFTGGAVGFLGYDAASWFEPSLDAVWSKQHAPSAGDDDAGFMLFDTILAFDHVKHRILIIATRVWIPERISRPRIVSPARRSIFSSRSWSAVCRSRPSQRGPRSRCDRTRARRRSNRRSWW